MPDTPRARTVRSEALRSRLVGWLKIALPMAALALLSTLFLLSREPDPDITPPRAVLSDGSGTLTEGVLNPSFSGTSPDGNLLTMTAETARPGADGAVNATNVSAGLTFGAGARVDLSAAAAILEDGKRAMRLEGGVTITTTDGYRIETEAFVARLATSEAFTPGPVTATGPVGRLEAGALRIRPGADADPSQGTRLLFTDGVRLVYNPDTGGD